MKYYLNNAATSYPKAPGVAEAVADCLMNIPGSANRGGLDEVDVFEQVRIELASLLGISNPNQIALCSNATHALNLAIFGFPFEQGDIVVTTVAEHNSVLRPLFQLEKKGTIKTVFVPTDEMGQIDTEEWEYAVNKYHPKLVVFTHASNVTGAINDAMVLTHIAKAAGAKVILDASQSLGITKVEAEKWGIDMVAFTGHKYLLGPQGTGGLYVSESISLSPYVVGGTGVFSDEDEMPKEMPMHLEAGTPNEPAFAGLHKALLWSKEHPIETKKINELCLYLKVELVRIGACVIMPSGRCTPVISFVIADHTATEIGDILTDNYNILCRWGLHCAPKIHAYLKCEKNGTLRISLSRFTTKKEVDEVIKAMEEIIYGLSGV